MLLTENKLCIETKGKSLFWCVMSESQPGLVNTLWVEQKCYRADETHYTQFKLPLYLFLDMFIMQPAMLISVSLRYLLPLFSLVVVVWGFLGGWGFVLRWFFQGIFGWLMFFTHCPLRAQRLFFLLLSYIFLRYSSMTRGHAECFLLPCTFLQPKVGTTWPLWSRGLGSCWLDSSLQQPVFPGVSPPHRAFPLPDLVLL